MKDAALYPIQQKLHRFRGPISSFYRNVAQYVFSVVREESKLHLYSLLTIILIAIGIRVFFLFRPMCCDEAYSFVHYASKPFFIGLSDYTYTNNHLFHTMLVHSAYLLFGNEPRVIRLPALIAGILLAPASYIVTRIFYNRNAALLSAALVASSSPLIEFSTNARGYTLTCLIFLLILGLATHLKQSQKFILWLLFAILSALGFYTIPIMLYPFGTVVIWLFLSIVIENAKPCRSLLLKRLFCSLAFAAFLTVILYLPALIVHGFQVIAAGKYLAPTSWPGFVHNLVTRSGAVWSRWNRDIPMGISLLLIAGFFISVAFYERLTDFRVPLVLAVVIWLVPVLTAYRVNPPIRNFLFLLLLYIMLASSGVNYLLQLITKKIGDQKSVVPVVLAPVLSFCLSLSLLHTKPFSHSLETGSFPAAEEISIFLKNYLKPGDRVWALGNTRGVFEYYFILYGIPLEYLESSDSDQYGSGRIIFMSYGKSQSSPAKERPEIFERINNSQPFTAPKLIKRCDFNISIYETYRIPRL